MRDLKHSNHGLRVVDGLKLGKEYRDALLPGEIRHDSRGRPRELPRYFYEIVSWDHAMSVMLTENFGLWELVQTDVRETPELQTFPRYVPCALTLLATVLEHLRSAVGTLVHVAANGGYRSPTHRYSVTSPSGASTHCWGTAANIYCIGDTMLDSRDAIAKYADIARNSIPGVWIRPYGNGPSEAEDHLHLDLGYVLSVPHDAPVDLEPGLGT